MGCSVWTAGRGVVALLSACLAGACGGSALQMPDAAPTVDARPRDAAPDATTADASACTPFLPGEVVGQAESPEITEASGAVASRDHPGVLWVHNDSGDGPRLFALSATGRHLGAYTLAGATATDWEDLALGSEPGADFLYVGDIGDNPRTRASVVVYRVPEPAVDPGQAPVTMDVVGAVARP